MRPGGCTSRMIDSAVTDLPLPDSPTRPSVSPARISKLTSSTAGDRRRTASVERPSSDARRESSDARRASQPQLRSSPRQASISRCSPNTARIASEISPTVACASTAAMIGGTRLRPSRAAAVDRVERGAPAPRCRACARTRAHAARSAALRSRDRSDSVGDRRRVLRRVRDSGSRRRRPARRESIALLRAVRRFLDLALDEAASRSPASVPPGASMRVEQRARARARSVGQRLDRVRRRRPDRPCWRRRSRTR